MSRKAAPPALHLLGRPPRSQNSEDSPSMVPSPATAVPGSPVTPTSGALSNVAASTTSRTASPLVPVASVSPAKRTKVVSIQGQMALDRDEIMERMASMENRWKAALSNVTQQLANSEAQRKRQQAQMDEYCRQTSQRLADFERENADLKRRLDEYEERDADRDESIPKTPKDVLGDDVWKAVRAVVHKSLQFLFNSGDAGWPDWPSSDEPWPCFPAENGQPGAPCMRLDWEESVRHENNVRMLDMLWRYIDSNRGSWPCDIHESLTAKDAPEWSFRQSASNYFVNLKRYRSRKKEGTVGTMTAILDDSQRPDHDVDGFQASLGLSAVVDPSLLATTTVASGEEYAVMASLSTLSPDVFGTFGMISNPLPSLPIDPVSSPTIPGQSEKVSISSSSSGQRVGFPDANRRRTRRNTSLAAVKTRRPLIPEYAGDAYEVLEENHSQISETGTGANRAWLQELWMSERNISAIKNILSAPAPTGLSTARSFNSTSRAGQEDSPMVVENPPFPQQHPERYLQRWQLNSGWLAANQARYFEKIVPVDEPTSFADVRRLEWFQIHHGRRSTSSTLGSSRSPTVLASPTLTESSLDTPTPLTHPLPTISPGSRDDSPAHQYDGFDVYDRDVSRRPRSRSPGKQHSVSAQLGRIVEERGVDVLDEANDRGIGGSGVARDQFGNIADLE